MLASARWVKLGRVNRFRVMKIPIGHRNPVKMLFASLTVFLWLGSIAHSQDHLSRALKLLQEGNLSAAEREAQAAVADPSTRARANATLGAIRLQQRKYAESEEYLRSAIRYDTRLVEAHINLGTVCNFQGKFAPAAEAFRSALALNPRISSAWRGLAQAEAARGEYRASLEAAKRVLGELRKSVTGLLLLATDYAGLKDDASVHGVLADWNALPQTDATSAINLASILETEGYLADAIAVLENAKKTGPLSFALSFTLAGCYLQSGDLTRASANYVVALSFDDNCIPCYRQIAAIAEKQRDLDQALSYLLMATRKAPQDPDILEAFGWVCMEKDLIDDAAKAFDKALEIRPGHESTMYKRASAHVGKKEYEAAVRLLEELVNRHPNDSGLNYALGSVLYLSVRLDESEKYLRRSVEFDPNVANSHQYLGLVLEGQNRVPEAIQTLEETARRFPDYAPAFEALGTLLFKNGNFPEAQKALERSIELNPDSMKAHYQLGMLLARAGKKQDSQAQLQIYKELQAKEQSQPQQVFLLTPP